MDCRGGPLARFYKLYKAGSITERELEEKIFRYISNSYFNECGIYFKDSVDRNDFLCRVYPKMRNAIRRYDSRCAPFDVYVTATIRYAYKFFRCRDKKRLAAENVYWNVCGDCSVNESEVPYQEPEPSADSGKPLPKHTLLLLLKSYYYVSDDMVKRAARALGMDTEVLGGMIDTLYRSQLEKITRLKRLINSAHCLYFRCLSYERQLADKYGNPQKRMLIGRYLERGRRRLADMRRRLKSTRIEATNSDLSKLLGIPKGTIASQLSSIRSRLVSKTPGNE